MHEYIYSDNGKFYRELTDICGKSILKEEITESEYLSYKNDNTEDGEITVEGIISMLQNAAVEALDSYEPKSNPTTDALNAEFALGKYHGIMNILERSSLSGWMKIADNTEIKRKTDTLLERTQQAYGKR